jgi:hypothetical protein
MLMLLLSASKRECDIVSRGCLFNAREVFLMRWARMRAAAAKYPRLEQEMLLLKRRSLK